MKSRTIIAAALAATVLLAGCAKKEEPKEEAKAAAPAVDIAAEEQAIRNRSAEWMNYANSKDVATIVNGVFSPDAIAVSGEGDVRKGSAAIQAGMEKDVKKMPDAVISWTTTTVNVAASGDMAVEKGDYYFDPDGSGKKPATAGTFVTVWEKIDGNWRATLDVAAENAASPAT